MNTMSRYVVEYALDHEHRAPPVRGLCEAAYRPLRKGASFTAGCRSQPA